jgi:hypothetical protein
LRKEGFFIQRLFATIREIAILRQVTTEAKPWVPSFLRKGGEAQMETKDVLTLMLQFGMFLIALLSLVIVITK